ncbi:DUF2442 domain-containing protein [Candidatus Poriferisocius sp.]|uniref:DUF2442 domain-containing protein n=1 Tax=Candidatus Poriferisocius sp. TaxID=3101276 RepID=UPI003B52361B
MLSPHVVELEVREQYKLWLRFDDGITGTVDLSDSAALGGVFAGRADERFQERLAASMARNQRILERLAQ